VVYSSDIIFWTGLMSLVLAVAAIASGLGATSLGGPVSNAILVGRLMIILTWPIMAYRLWIAYKKYLTFHMPLATIIFSQLIAAMMVLCFLVLTN
jgi:hypothetical protein